MVKIPSLQELLEAGVHFGHKVSRWNPKMKSYIFGSSAGVHVIDLEKTAKQLEAAATFIKEIAKNGGTTIFLGTKKQAAEIVKNEAVRAGAMYLTLRWPGGLLTNFDSVKKTIEKLPALEEELKTEEGQLTKKERLLIQRQINRLQKFLGGIRELESLPDCLFVVDARREDAAVKEANKMGIPVAAMVDTNGDPTKLAYPIAANDDALRSVSLVVKTIAEAYKEGRAIWEKKKAKEATKVIKETEETKERKAAEV